MKRVLIGLLILFSVLAWNQTTKADDFASDFQSAIKTFPPTPNIAGMGGVWAALPSPYSSNPAAFPRIKEYELKGGMYGSYYSIDFRQGPDIELWSGTGLATLGLGVFRVDYYDFDSEQFEKARGKNGLETEIKGKSLEVGFGIPLNEKFSIGVALIPVCSSKARFSSSGFLTAEGKSKIVFGSRIGFLYNPFEKLFFGLVYEYNKNELKNNIFNPLTFTYTKSSEHPTTHLIRPGIVVKPWKGGTIGADYLWGRIDNQDKDYKIGKWFLGAEQWVSTDVALRAGLADGYLTGGIGVKKKNLLIDYAYIARSMRNMSSHFGHSSAHTVSLTMTW